MATILTPRIMEQIAADMRRMERKYGLEAAKAGVLRYLDQWWLTDDSYLRAARSEVDELCDYP